MNRKTQDEFIFPFEKLDTWKLAVELADYVLNILS